MDPFAPISCSFVRYPSNVLPASAKLFPNLIFSVLDEETSTYMDMLTRNILEVDVVQISEHVDVVLSQDVAYEKFQRNHRDGMCGTVHVGVHGLHHVHVGDTKFRSVSPLNGFETLFHGIFTNTSEPRTRTLSYYFCSGRSEIFAS